MKHSFLYISFTLLSFSLLAQPVQYSINNNKAIKTFEKGNKLAANRDFKGAIELWEKSCEMAPDFFEAHIQLIDVYDRMYPDKKKWFEHLELVVKLENKTVYNMTKLYMVYAKYLFEHSRYDESLIYFNKMLKAKTVRQDVADFANKHIIEANYGKEAMKNKLNYTPRRMSNEINFAKRSYFPAITADNRFMIYTAMSERNRNKNEDMIIAQRDGTHWTNPQSIAKNINTIYNEGAGTISGDSRTLVFTRCNQPDGIGSCDLYISYRTGNEWSDPTNMGRHINSKRWDSQPSLSTDGRTLIFSSNRPGGNGKEDLYICKRLENGAWSYPKNMGTYVNTPERELSPFLHANSRTLYFASTGYYEQNFGGFDLFHTDIITKNKPQNLGYPLNTPKNQTTLFITSDSKKGYYSEDDDDQTKDFRTFLYEFDVPDPIKPAYVANYARGTVKDADTKKYLKAVVELIDLKTHEVKQKVEADPKTGEYLVTMSEGNEYGLYVTHKGYLHESKYLDYRTVNTFDPQQLDVELKLIKTGQVIVLANIFFKSGSYELDDKSKSELDKVARVMADNKTIKVEFSGHTDDVGSDSDNQTLSMNRAKSVYQYLVRSGTDKARLQYKGYGETKPLVANDSDKNRAKNRRIEFKVL